MDNELVFKIIFTVIVIIFISITVIKRFCYFKPIEKYIETKEKYVMVKHKHIFGWVLNNNLHIACGTGSIIITEIQRPGKTIQKANDFLLGFSIPKGTQLF